MQDQYVGDIGDFGKYGLLRAIFGRPEVPESGCGLRLGVAWYLSEGKPGSGGNLTDYPNLRECDPYLYDGLKHLIESGNRTVAEVVRSRILPNDTAYHKVLFSSNTRKKWFKDTLKETEGADVVFVDPDNGVASENTPLGSAQHVLPYELERFFERGQSLVIYHHLTRQGKAPEQIDRLAKKLKEYLELPDLPWSLWYHRGTARAYFIVLQDSHRNTLESRLKSFLDSPWCAKPSPHFQKVI